MVLDYFYRLNQNSVGEVVNSTSAIFTSQIFPELYSAGTIFVNQLALDDCYVVNLMQAILIAQNMFLYQL